jgi:hypothetical protein
MQRRPIEQSTPLIDRLAQTANDARERAKTLRPGKEREELLRLARQSETASHIEDWLNSPGLRPPK